MEPRFASEPSLSASETLIVAEAPSSAADASIVTADASISAADTSIVAADTSISAADTSISAAKSSIVTAKTLLIEEASAIFKVSVKTLQDTIENGFRREDQDAAYDTCEDKISEPQFDALIFVIKYYNTDCFLSMIKDSTTTDTIDELKRALTWIEQFKKFEHIFDSGQYDRNHFFTLDWRPPVSAAIVKPSFTPVEGSLESMLQECHAIIIKKGDHSWKNKLDAQLTAIKRKFSIYFKDLNREIVSPLEASNHRIRFAALKRRVLQAVHSYLLVCISNVENDIAHEYSVDEQCLFPVESSTSRVKSLISAIDKLTSFIRAISRIFKNIPAALKNFYWSRMRQSGTGASDDLSCLLEFAGVALASDFHETPRYCCEPELDYYNRRTLENSMTSPTNSNENLESKPESETLSDVINSQPKYKQLRVSMMSADFQYAGHNSVKLDEFQADTAPDDLFALPIENDEVDDFDYNAPIKGVLHFGRYDNQLLSILMTITKMQKVVDAAESSLTPDNEATHESANLEYNTNFKPILDEMVSKLTGILSIFDGFIAQCNEALAVPEISEEKLKQVNTVLKKNKSPAKKNDAEGI